MRVLPLLVALSACGGSEAAPAIVFCDANGACPDGFSCHTADNNCRATGTASAGVTAAAVAPDSHQVDKVSPRDGAIASDGAKDAAFDLTVTGPLSALAIIVTDANGKGTSNQIWDSIVGTDPIPAGMMVGFSVGSQTWQVGVFEGDTLLNRPDGRLPPLDGTHQVRLYASDSGYFKPGTSFRLIAELPDGSLTLGPVFVYPQGAF
jgi:hypothetical protein